jgi:hypothetical protein
VWWVVPADAGRAARTRDDQKATRADKKASAKGEESSAGGEDSYLKRWEGIETRVSRAGYQSDDQLLLAGGLCSELIQTWKRVSGTHTGKAERTKVQRSVSMMAEKTGGGCLAGEGICIRIFPVALTFEASGVDVGDA